MKILRCFFMAGAATLLLGCKTTLHVQNYQAPANKLSPEDGVFIIVPPDAYDEPGSGKKCAETLLEAFKPHASRLKLSEEVATLSIQVRNAGNQGFAYVLDPKIYKWEEEPTEWTGKPDVLDIGLRLLQTPEGKVVSETRFDGKSKWATFGGDHVEHLLKPLADEWVRAMYEGTEFNGPPAKGRTK